MQAPRFLDQTQDCFDVTPCESASATVWRTNSGNFGFVCFRLLRTKGLCRPMFRDVGWLINCLKFDVNYVCFTWERSLAHMRTAYSSLTAPAIPFVRPSLNHWRQCHTTIPSFVKNEKISVLELVPFSAFHWFTPVVFVRREVRK
jgi:hypothetical protein